MNNLISLEKRRTDMRIYNISAVLTGIFLLGMLYLFAFIPHFDPVESQEKLFTSYSGLSLMISILSMAAFSILSSVMGAKVVISEYSAKRAVFILTYPIDRKDLLIAKFIFVFSYTFKIMLICTGSVLSVFFLSECIVPVCAEQLSVKAVMVSIFYMFFCAILSVMTGIISVWFGFRRFSVSAAIVSAVIIVCLICQIASAAFFDPMLLIIMILPVLLLSVTAFRSVCLKVENMEV